jgi:hypothetical protein
MLRTCCGDLLWRKRKVTKFFSKWKKFLNNFSWPKRRLLVPGDTVVFNFHANSLGSDWGYRCIVIGHMPNSDQVF